MRGIIVLVVVMMSVNVDVVAASRMPGLTEKVSSGAQCTFVDSSSSVAQKRRSTGSPDVSCAASAGSLKKELERGDLSVVDIRSKSEFDGIHALGAINLPSSTVISKEFLKEKHVVLVDAGKGDFDAYLLCSDLKSAGFKRVSVLRGGVWGWIDQGLPTTGQASERKSLSSSELFRASKFAANSVVVLDNNIALGKQLSGSLVIRDHSAMAIKNVLSKLDKRHEEARSIVLVGDALKNAALVDQLRSSLGDSPVLIYSDSASEYERFLTTQEALWKAKEKGPRQGCTF